MVEADTNASSPGKDVQSDGGETRPSLAERLMNGDPSTNTANAATSRAGAPRSGDRSITFRPQITPPSLGLDNALKEARNYIRLRYAVFLVTVVGLLVLTLIGAATFISEMLGSRSWEKLALSGGLGLVSLAMLVVLQYRPANGFRLAAVQWAQLEAVRQSLNHSVELWDEFLTHREATNELSPADITAAVSSLTAASRAFTDLESRLHASSPGREPTRPQIPTPSAPDPGRYS